MAKVTADAKIEDAKAQAEQMKLKAQEEGARQADTILKKSEADTASQKERVKSAIDLQRRTRLLEAKQEMIAEIISNEEEEFYMICPKCGSEMPDDSAFCTRCGASLHTGTQENQNSQGGPQQGIPQGTPYGYGNPQGNY